jgi:uncharacterized membrane protein
MESKNKFFGHPVHPLLIVVPLGMFIGTMVVDTIYLFNGNPLLPAVSFFNIAIGVVAGLVAALFGFLDWLAVPPNTRAKTIGGWHGIGNVVVVGMFAASWWLRSMTVNFQPTQPALILSYSAVILGTITAWLGGELVFRLNVGVDHGAHLDAPSSLSDQPATGKPARGTSSSRQPARSARR